MTTLEIIQSVVIVIGGAVLVLIKANNLMQESRRSDAQKEQAWINDQQRQFADRWIKKFDDLELKTNVMQNEHVRCREESAVLRSHLADANERIVSLRSELESEKTRIVAMQKELETEKKRISALESQSARIGG